MLIISQSDSIFVHNIVFDLRGDQEFFLLYRGDGQGVLSGYIKKGPTPPIALTSNRRSPLAPISELSGIEDVEDSEIVFQRAQRQRAVLVRAPISVRELIKE